MFSQISEKFSFRKKKSHRKWAKILKKLIFAKFSITNIIFYVKIEFRMFQAFIWYTYYPCRVKIVEGQIFHLWFFRGLTSWLRRPLTGKVWNIGKGSKSLHVDKDPNFHLRPCFIDLKQNWGRNSSTNYTVLIPPLPVRGCSQKARSLEG